MQVSFGPMGVLKLNERDGNDWTIREWFFSEEKGPLF